MGSREGGTEPHETQCVAGRVDTALTSLARLVRGPRLSTAMGSRQPDAIEPALYPVLVGIVDIGPMRLTDLCNTVSLRMSTLSRHVSELESRGLVTREVDPTDSRAARLTATPRGRRLVARIRQAWWTTIDAIIDEWTPAEKEQFVTAMDRFRTGLLGELDRHSTPARTRRRP